jgi:hypothetical protein
MVLNVVLGLFVVLLGVQVTRTWMRTVPAMRVPVAAPGEPAKRREPRSKAAGRGENGEEQVALITSMDLFDSSRQAVGLAVESTVAVEMPPPTGIEVVGIRLLAGDQEAFIRDASQANAQRRVREGDEVAGYTVQAINPTNVELGNAAGQSVTLWLQLAPSAGAKPGGPAGGARPGGAPVPRPGGPAGPMRAGVAAGQPGAVARPPIDPTAAQRQRQRQQQLQRQRQRGGGAAVPPAVQQLRNQMGKGA